MLDGGSRSSTDGQFWIAQPIDKHCKVKDFGMLYTTMNAARMTESTEMLFWTQTHVGVSNHVLNWGAHRYHPVNTTDQSLWQLQMQPYYYYTF